MLEKDKKKKNEIEEDSHSNYNQIQKESNEKEINQYQKNSDYYEKKYLNFVEVISSLILEKGKPRFKETWRFTS